MYKANRKERYADQTEEERLEFEQFLESFKKQSTYVMKKGYLTIKYKGVKR